MFKGRRVGTLTAGIVLIVFGLLYLSRLIFPGLEYRFIFSLWPLILVLAGVEMLVFFMGNRGEPMKYDVGAIVLVIMLIMFAMVMAVAEFIIERELYLSVPDLVRRLI